MVTEEVKRKFVNRRGFFNQPYKSIRLSTCEITIDNLLPDNQYQLSICTPYHERIDQVKHKVGAGAGEVKKSWYFENEDDLFEFVSAGGII
jgi:hypothetical protein